MPMSCANRQQSWGLGLVAFHVSETPVYTVSLEIPPADHHWCPVWVGRRRRKKCDETRPRCAACTRNELDCEWPSGNEPADRRIRKRHRHMVCDASPQPPSCLSIVRQPSTLAIPSPFRTDGHFYLYQHFVSVILPRLVRQSSIDQTYMLCLAPEYPPLMGAMISVAGMQIASRPKWSIECAVQSYLYTIISLQKSLVDMKRAGNDDRLLATVILLAVFEVCLPSPSKWKPREGQGLTSERLLD